MATHWRRSRRLPRSHGARSPNAPIEPNGYYLPDWELAVNASARGRTGVSALARGAMLQPAPDGAARLIGLLPVISLWRAYKIPLPALVSADPYGTLCTPLLDRDMANEAVARLMQQARQAGAHALILRDVALDGAAMKAITRSAAARRHAPAAAAIPCPRLP